MSIAISAIVKPSKRLLMAARSICIAIAVIGLASGLGWLGNFAEWARFLLAGVTSICSLFALLHLQRHQKAYRVDIRGDGTIRLGLAQGALSDQVELVQLLDSSTMWPGVMLIWLQAESGRKTVLKIFSDSVTQDEFRALSVALHWLALHRSSLGLEGHQDANFG